MRWGSYRRTCPRVRTIARFRCSLCRRTFSRQTFQTTYWLRRPGLLRKVCEGLLSGSGLRQISRFAGGSPSTIANHAARLGRHALLFLEAHRPRGEPGEPITVDGFESFAYSQFYPLHLNLAVGTRSHFVYGLTESELRRKGRMTVAQKRQRAVEEAEVGRPDPRAIERGMGELLALVVPAGARAHVHSDDHRAYPRALRRLRDRAFEHTVTPSKVARTPSNPLFPVNRQDEMLRHSGANHRRETIAFSKLRAAVIERAALHMVWMSFVKSFSEKRQGATPAQHLGLTDHKLTIEELLGKRQFPSRVRLPEVWQRYYDRDVPTRRIPNHKRHTLSYAY